MSIFKNNNWTYINANNTTRLYIEFKNPIKNRSAYGDQEILQYIFVKYEDNTKSAILDIKIEKLNVNAKKDNTLSYIGNTVLPFELNSDVSFKYLFTKQARRLIYVPVAEGSTIDTKLIDVNLYTMLRLQLDAIKLNVDSGFDWDNGLTGLGFNDPTFVNRINKNYKLYHHNGIELMLYKEIADFLGYKHNTPFISVKDKQIYIIDNLDDDTTLESFLIGGHIVNIAVQEEINTDSKPFSVDILSKLDEEPKTDTWSEIIVRKEEKVVHPSMRLSSYNGISIDEIMDADINPVFDGNISRHMSSTAIINILITLLDELLVSKNVEDTERKETLIKVKSIVETIQQIGTLERSTREITSLKLIKDQYLEYVDLVGNSYLDLVFYIFYISTSKAVRIGHQDYYRQIFKYFNHGDVIISLDHLYSGKQYRMDIFLNQAELDFNTKPQSVGLLSSKARLFDKSGRIAEKVKQA